MVYWKHFGKHMWIIKTTVQTRESNYGPIKLVCVYIHICLCVWERELEQDMEKEKLGESVKVGQKYLNVQQRQLGSEHTTESVYYWHEYTFTMDVHTCTGSTCTHVYRKYMYWGWRESPQFD